MCQMKFACLLIIIQGICHCFAGEIQTNKSLDGRPLPPAVFDKLCGLPKSGFPNAKFCKQADVDDLCIKLGTALAYKFSQCQNITPDLRNSKESYDVCALTNNANAQLGNDQDFVYITTNAVMSDKFDGIQMCIANDFKVLYKAKPGQPPK